MANKFLARGGKTQSLIGDEAKNRVVLGEYPSMEAFTAFWNDAKDDFKVGQKYSSGMRLIAVEGIDRSGKSTQLHLRLDVVKEQDRDVSSQRG